MRPGPGLVVMALAFISGARRGSSSSTTTTITSGLEGGGVGGEGATLPSSYDESRAAAAAAGSAASGLEEGTGGSKGISSGSFWLPVYLPSPSPPPNHLQLDIYNRPTTQIERNLPSSRRRRRRNIEAAEDGEEEEEAAAVEAGGLPVQFSSSSSQALDEDEDIFALVAEDDLLSEESFQRLIKLSEKEVDQDDEQQQQQEPDEEQEQDQEEEEDYKQEDYKQQQQQQQQDEESRLIDDTELQLSHNDNNNNNKREASSSFSHHILDAIQTAQLIGHKDTSVASKTSSSSSSSSSTESSPETESLPPAPINLKESILAATASSLTRLNPWISACDLAQPTGTGTDLQGQCSAGTLPMAWVDEGPGPPICPRSCAAEIQQPIETSASYSDSNWSDNNNKVKYFINAKTLKMRLSNKNNNYNSNNKANYKPMSRIRRNKDIEATSASEGAAAASTPPATDLPQTTEMEIEIDGNDAEIMSSTLATTTMATASVEDEVVVEEQDEEEEEEEEQHQEEEEVEEMVLVGPQQTQLEQEPLAESESEPVQENSMPTLSYSHLHVEQTQQAEEQRQSQQQCLDYLGDAAETSPQHLCTLRSPGQLLERLRSLRLRNCCERSVFSALHTIALNATLSDRSECIRILKDLLDVDSLANRITCELAEILFRFDCRQVYSLINQCDDCKAAYRRWVCSTLVPYFAEPKDVAPVAAATDAADTNDQHQSKSTVKRSTRNAAAAAEAASVSATSVGGGGQETGIQHKSLKLISNNNKSNNGNNMNGHQINQQQQQNAKSASKDNGQHQEKFIDRQLAQTFYNVVGLAKAVADTDSEQQQQQQHQQKQQQSNNFISTANNSDPRAMDPVISKLQKRSTRKAELRKRRRIRPCLSVCQTVEQKCPYLLPADRAPALPTQYAGEPTFLCLDQNIPETGEQLKKSSYGPNDCCYSYCNGPFEGICTICPNFALESASTVNSSTAANATRRVHNITLTLSSPAGEHARAKSVALALRNVTKVQSVDDEVALLQRLPYYAHHDSIYYYDEDGDMPEAPLSGGCATVPTVTSRCTIPYYASGTEATSKPLPSTKLLIWLSALLGLLSSCRGGAAAAAASMTGSSSGRTKGGGGGLRRHHHHHHYHECTSCRAQNHEQEIRQIDDGQPSIVAITKRNRQQHQDQEQQQQQQQQQQQHQQWAWKWAWAWAWAWSLNITYKLTLKCGSNHHTRCRSRSKFKCKPKLKPKSSIDNNGSRTSIGCDSSSELICIRTRNYRYFYYYNYNINDWWRRWWRCLWLNRNSDDNSRRPRCAL